tara:strand:+ start:360 stop:593 length:234 start_codon:yes stop_codon:yes gene_type:complete
MKQHKEYFKHKCSEFIWMMINNESVDYKTFYNYVESVELLMDNFVLDMDNNATCLLHYQDILRTYISKLNELNTHLK